MHHVVISSDRMKSLLEHIDMYRSWPPEVKSLSMVGISLCLLMLQGLRLLEQASVRPVLVSDQAVLGSRTAERWVLRQRQKTHLVNTAAPVQQVKG